MQRLLTFYAPAEERHGRIELCIGVNACIKTKLLRRC